MKWIALYMEWLCEYNFCVAINYVWDLDAIQQLRWEHVINNFNIYQKIPEPTTVILWN